MSNLNSPEYREDQDSEIYRELNITAIHVAPDDNPVLDGCDCISFVYFSKKESDNKTKEVVLFGGGYKEDLIMCSLTHQSLVDQAIELGIISEKTKIEGGGVLNAHTFKYMKSSNLYGKPDREILEDFIDLAENHFRKKGFQF